MKHTLTIVLFSIINSLFAQKINYPALENSSKTSISIIKPLTPGTKILFSQKCIKGYNETVPNGVVQFQKLIIKNSTVFTSIEFKDTIVQKLIFFFDARDNDVTDFFEIPKEHFIRLKPNYYYQSYIKDDLEYTCFKKRKKATLIVSRADN